VETSFGIDERYVMADRDKLLQALRNLTENCWNYTPPHGRVTISIERVDEGLKVDFANSGPGITADDLPYIFERFFRADRSRSRDGGGAGIGLAITRELVEAHGGRVGAESAPGETHVWLVLPC
ncbi:MAG: sensor histidine kinase, partial [Desulfofustis sp.]|nr:sensor histidine kinase [Desulfofustis sp.]